jgi:hypothetical protein
MQMQLCGELSLSWFPFLLLSNEFDPIRGRAPHVAPVIATTSSIKCFQETRPRGDQMPGGKEKKKEKKESRGSNTHTRTHTHTHIIFPPAG